MGGKTWSYEEEDFFWRTIVPQSPKAIHPVDRVRKWDQLAVVMIQHFGKERRRDYTKLMLFEHYFQNVETGHISPRAHQFVSEHKKQKRAAKEADCKTGCSCVKCCSPPVLAARQPAKSELSPIKEIKKKEREQMARNSAIASTTMPINQFPTQIPTMQLSEVSHDAVYRDGAFQPQFKPNHYLSHGYRHHTLESRVARPHNARLRVQQLLPRTPLHLSTMTNGIKLPPLGFPDWEPMTHDANQSITSPWAYKSPQTTVRPLASLDTLLTSSRFPVDPSPVSSETEHLSADGSVHAFLSESTNSSLTLDHSREFPRINLGASQEQNFDQRNHEQLS